MRKLLDFLVRKRHWFLFLLLEIISFSLIYRNHAYQRNIILSSANVVTGQIESVAASIHSYLNLQEENKNLQERNSQLEQELLKLQDQLEVILADTVNFAGFAPDSTESFPYEFIPATVVANSASALNNYITIDKGSKDGILPDMGVVSERGIVGIVSNVNDHYAVIIPLINPRSRLSCKIHRTNYIGSMSWDGRDARYSFLYELPTHAEFVEGDTIVTSGFSAVFPPGVTVGHVLKQEKLDNTNFYSLKIELATNFWTLKNVWLIKNYQREGQITLEEEARKND